MLADILLPSPLEQLTILPKQAIWMKRDDLIHPIVAGNKWRKLAGFFAKLSHPTTVVSFGGAYSNHLAATAACIKAYGHQGIFIIRGHELNPYSSEVLTYCQQQGMQLRFIERQTYLTLRLQEWQLTPQQIAIWRLPSHFKALAEGGAGLHNLVGCVSLWQEIESQFIPDNIWLPAGTGSTCQGLLHAMPNNAPTTLNVVSAVKGSHQERQATQAIAKQKRIALQWIDETTFGGFAKTNHALRQSQKTFEKNTGITIDAVYNAKVWWHLHQHLRASAAQETHVWIHTGGFRNELIASSTV